MIWIYEHRSWELRDCWQPQTPATTLKGNVTLNESMDGFICEIKWVRWLPSKSTIYPDLVTNKFSQFLWELWFFKSPTAWYMYVVFSNSTQQVNVGLKWVSTFLYHSVCHVSLKCIVVWGNKYALCSDMQMTPPLWQKEKN